MRETGKIIREIFTNLITLHRLALNTLLVQNKGSLLGIIWLWINPAIQIAIYGFVFGTGLRGSAPVDGIPYFYWLISGFVMWMFISNVVTTSSRSIVNKMGIVTRMRFPISIIPGVVVVSELYIHILILVTAIIILIFGGIYPTQYTVYIIYYMIAAICFLYSLAIFNSAITTVIRDYQHIVYNVMRTMFFVTPIIFPADSMKGMAMKIVIRINPFSYLLSGYRDSLVFGNHVTFSSFYWGIYFWGITIILLVVGSMLHVKMRKNLLDFA